MREKTLQEERECEREREREIGVLRQIRNYFRRLLPADKVATVANAIPSSSSPCKGFNTT